MITPLEFSIKCYEELEEFTNKPDPEGDEINRQLQKLWHLLEQLSFNSIIDRMKRKIVEKQISDLKEKREEHRKKRFAKMDEIYNKMGKFKEEFITSTEGKVIHDQLYKEYHEKRIMLTRQYLEDGTAEQLSSGIGDIPGYYGFFYGRPYCPHPLMDYEKTMKVDNIHSQCELDAITKAVLIFLKCIPNKSEDITYNCSTLEDRLKDIGEIDKLEIALGHYADVPLKFEQFGSNIVHNKFSGINHARKYTTGYYDDEKFKKDYGNGELIYCVDDIHAIKTTDIYQGYRENLDNDDRKIEKWWVLLFQERIRKKLESERLALKEAEEAARRRLESEELARVASEEATKKAVELLSASPLVDELLSWAISKFNSRGREYAFNEKSRKYVYMYGGLSITYKDVFFYIDYDDERIHMEYSSFFNAVQENKIKLRTEENNKYFFAEHFISDIDSDELLNALGQVLAARLNVEIRTNCPSWGKEITDVSIKEDNTFEERSKTAYDIVVKIETPLSDEPIRKWY